MITIEIGNLEIELGGLLGALLHIQREIGEIVYLSPRGALARLSVIKNVTAAILEKDSEGAKAVRDVLDRAKAVMNKRHALVHEAWGVHRQRREVHRMEMPSKGDSKPVALNELTDVIERVRELAHDVRQLRQDAYDAWPAYTWQDKQP